MASVGTRSRRRPASTGFLLLVTLPAWTASAQEFPFSNLGSGRYFAPSLEIPFTGTDPGGDRRKAEIEDFRERLKVGRRIEKEIWKAGLVPEVTLTVLRNLVQGASISFDLVLDWEGRGTFEVAVPLAPDQGPVAVWFNERPTLEMDPWSERREPIEWFHAKDPVEVRSGTNTVRIIQQSPQDLPIRLDSLRFTPLPKGTQPATRVTP